jgi:hypothetical protein
MLSDSHAAASSVSELWHEAKREAAMKKRVQIRTLNKLRQFESEPSTRFSSRLGAVAIYPQALMCT